MRKLFCLIIMVSIAIFLVPACIDDSKMPTVEQYNSSSKLTWGSFCDNEQCYFISDNSVYEYNKSTMELKEIDTYSPESNLHFDVVDLSAMVISSNENELLSAKKIKDGYFSINEKHKSFNDFDISNFFTYYSHVLHRVGLEQTDNIIEFSDYYLIGNQYLINQYNSLFDQFMYDEHGSISRRGDLQYYNFPYFAITDGYDIRIYDVSKNELIWSMKCPGTPAYSIFYGISKYGNKIYFISREGSFFKNPKDNYMYPIIKWQKHTTDIIYAYDIIEKSLEEEFKTKRSEMIVRYNDKEVYTLDKKGVLRKRSLLDSTIIKLGKLFNVVENCDDLIIFFKINEDKDNYNVTLVDVFDTSTKQWLEIELE